MSSDERGTANSILRAWLQSERRLGIGHLPVAPLLQRSTPARSIGVGRSDAGREAQESLGRANSPYASAAGSARAQPSTRSQTATTPPPQAAPPRGRPAAVMLPVMDDPTLPSIIGTSLSPDDRKAAMDDLDRRFVKPCQKCELHAAGRKQTVFGVGTLNADLVFVGEGPGADEDEQGVPFVGRAGQLLTRMIAAMGLTREQVYICNIVKCRPPGNRTPLEPEMAACSPYLWRQLAMIRPKVIVTLGRPASQTLLATTTTISQLRGNWHDFPPPPLAALGLPPIKLMPTFHPAYLLRSPDEKAKTWDDLQQVMRLLGLPLPKRG